MAGQALVSMHLTPERCAQFLQARREAGHTHGLSQRSLEPLLDYLRGLELVAAISEPDRTTSVECLLALYERYLVRERGLMAATVGNYMTGARRFLSECSAVASVAPLPTLKRLHHPKALSSSVAKRGFRPPLLAIYRGIQRSGWPRPGAGRT
jgi:hypothetical protein